MKLLDTSVMIDLDRGTPGTAEKASQLDRSGPHALSAVTLFEFPFGVHIKYHDEGLDRAITAVEDLLSALVVLPLDEETSKVAAQIAAKLRRSGKEIGIQDVYLAATAIRNDLPLLTGNPRHFRRVAGLRVEKW